MKSVEATPRRRWRPSLFWLWAAPLALALAWLASNLVDDRSQPRPTALQLDSAVVAAPLTAALTGLFAAETAPERATAPGAAARPAAQAADAARQLPANLALLGCERGTDCVARWQQALADGSLAGQLQGHNPLRQRCEAALAPALQPGAALERLFTGPLSLPFRLGVDRASQGRGGVQCSKLLIGQALLAAARPSLWHHLHWRNTLGEWLLALGVPALEPYQSRQADVGLHHRALAAALTTSAERCPTAEFSTRLAAFAPPTLAARILLADDGRTLLAARWGRSTVDGEPQPAIRVPLPAIH